MKRMLAAAMLILSACANTTTEDASPSTAAEVTTTMASPTSTTPSTTTTTAPTTTTTVATTTTTTGINWVETEPSARPVTNLLEPGTDPLEIHQYELEVGTTAAGLVTLELAIDQTFDTETFSTSNTVAMEFTTEVIDVDERGFVVEFTYIDVEATSTDATTQDALEETYASLQGVSLLQLIGRNGESLASSGFEDVPGAELFQGGLAGASVPLPSEPFGVGAVWESVGSIFTNGVEFVSTTTVTVAAIEGDLLTLEMSGSQTLGEGGMAALLGGLDPSEFEAELTTIVTGDAVWDLTSPTPVDSIGLSEQDYNVTVTAAGQEGTLVQRTTTEARFSSR